MPELLSALPWNQRSLQPAEQLIEDVAQQADGSRASSMRSTRKNSRASLMRSRAQLGGDELRRHDDEEGQREAQPQPRS